MQSFLLANLSPSQIRLRSTLDAILMNAARDLRTKADNVERAFTKRIACMDEIRIKLENELVDVTLITIIKTLNIKISTET